MRRLNIKFYKGMNIKNTSKKKHNKGYETSKNIGGNVCKIYTKWVQGKTITRWKKFYQYTYIDETTRERFLYWYEVYTIVNTVDFVKRLNNILMAVLKYLTPK